MCMLLVIIVVVCLSIGYSAYNRDLMISGEGIVRADVPIRVENISLKSTQSGAREEYNPEFTVDTTSSFVSLPIGGEIVYEIIISNTSDKRVLVEDIIANLSNENISYKIDGLDINEVYSGSNIVFILTLFNDSDMKQSGNITINYDLEIFDGYIITLVQGDNIVEDLITKDTISYHVTLNDDVVLRCDYGSIPNITNDKLTIKNISNDTTCSFYNDLSLAINEANNSDNYLLMLKNYYPTSTISIPEDKSMQLDLNGKLIESSVRTIYNMGKLILTDTLEGGTISTTGNNTQVIYNNGGDLTLKNGKIKSTTTCDVWSCSSLYNTNHSLLNITPIKETSFQEDGTYQTGVYIEQTYGIMIWTHSGTVSNIYGGEYKMLNDTSTVGWQIFTCSTCDTLNIYDAHTTGNNYSSPIRGQQSGTINVYGGTFENPNVVRYIIGADADFNGTINLYGGTGIGGGLNSGIANAGVNSYINICNFTFQNVQYDVLSNNGTIRYRDGVNWVNGSIPTLAEGIDIIKDNDMVCTN